MTKKQQKTKKLNTDQKIDQVLEIVQGLTMGQDSLVKGQKTLFSNYEGLAKKQEELAENQELMLKTMNDFSTRIEEKIDIVDRKVGSTETSLIEEMQKLETRMVSKVYLDRKLAEAGLKTSKVLV